MKFIHPTNIQFRKPEEKDLGLIRQLLLECNLPYSDIDITKQYFSIAENEGEMIGCCGFEAYGENGLFRSLAVDTNYRNLRIGRLLTDKITNFATEMGVREFYLLTTTAVAFFAKRGWTETDRMSVPIDLSRTTEFMTICPSTAICMIYNLEQAKR